MIASPRRCCVCRGIGFQLDPLGRATYGSDMLAFVAKQPKVTRVFDELKRLTK
jgi:hypothetical protein